MGTEARLIQAHYGSEAPQGASLLDAFNGAPSRDRVPLNAGGVDAGAVPLPPGGAPYDDGRSGLCRGNDNTCKAGRVKGKEFCVGHERSEAKKAREAAE